MLFNSLITAEYLRQWVKMFQKAARIVG